MDGARDLMNRVRNMVAFGVTKAAVSAPGNVAQVQVQLATLELLTLQVVEQRGHASNLPVGTPVVAVFTSGDRSNGVIIGSAAPGSRPAMSGPEDAALYGYGWSIMVASDGIHITAPNVFLNGNLVVKGDITGGSTTGDQVGLRTHRHPGNNTPPTAGT